jgi:hypothetical protein
MLSNQQEINKISVTSTKCDIVTARIRAEYLQSAHQIDSSQILCQCSIHYHYRLASTRYLRNNNRYKQSVTKNIYS